MSLYSIRHLSESIIQSSGKKGHVYINEEKLDQYIQNNNISEVKNLTNKITEIDLFKLLIINSVNYCFWKDRSYNYPKDSSSSKLMNIGLTIFSGIKVDERYDKINRFKEELIKEQFTLPEIRLLCIQEIEDNYNIIPNKLIPLLNSNNTDPDDFAYIIDKYLPYFKRDVFRKRLLLLIHMIQENHNCFSCTKELPIPSDYQIPKCLNILGLTSYSTQLSYAINNHKQIPTNTPMEHQIRAAAIVICSKIAKAKNISNYSVDQHFFSKRKQFTEPHHLTITTDY